MIGRKGLFGLWILTLPWIDVCRQIRTCTQNVNSPWARGRFLRGGGHFCWQRLPMIFRSNMHWNWRKIGGALFQASFLDSIAISNEIIVYFHVFIKNLYSLMVLAKYYLIYFYTYWKLFFYRIQLYIHNFSGTAKNQLNFARMT